MSGTPGFFSAAGAIVVISVMMNGSPSISLISPTSGQSVAQGQTLTISWVSQNAPPGSAVAIFVLPTNSSNVAANTYPYRIQSRLSTSGTYSWEIPFGSSACVPDAPPAYCGSYIAQNGPNYQIVAKLYTPSNAIIQGMRYDPMRVPTYLATVDSGTFTIDSD